MSVAITLTLGYCIDFVSMYSLGTMVIQDGEVIFLEAINIFENNCLEPFQAPSSSEELSPIPANVEVEQASEDVPEKMEVVIGEDTDQVFIFERTGRVFSFQNSECKEPCWFHLFQLSDVTDPEKYSTRSSSSSSNSQLATWLSVSFLNSCLLLPY